jgi:anti-sigma regulatory factor (Ser/Thr protein kinase)
MTLERTFANTTGSIVKARRYAVDALVGSPPEVIDSVAVMVSELATNSVRHADSDFTVTIDRDGDRVRVAVADAGSRLPSLRTPEPSEHSGRGLQIVDALADEWGVTEMADRAGKSVWFVLSLESQVTDADSRRAASSRTSEPQGAGPAGASRQAPIRKSSGERRDRRGQSRAHRRHQPATAAR